MKSCWRRRGRLVGVVALLGSTTLALSCAGAAKSDASGARTKPPAFVVGDEAEDVLTWARSIDDEARGVSVGTPGDGTWTVNVNVAEFLRDDPLESEMRSLVMQAIRDVPGVDDVYEEDREVWVVTGDPAGEELLSAVGGAVDVIAPRAQAEIEKP